MHEGCPSDLLAPALGPPELHILGALRVKEVMRAAHLLVSLGPVEVAAGDVGPPQAHLPHHAHCHLLVGCVQDRHLHTARLHG